MMTKVGFTMTYVVASFEGVDASFWEEMASGAASLWSGASSEAMKGGSAAVGWTKGAASDGASWSAGAAKDGASGAGTAAGFVADGVSSGASAASGAVKDGYSGVEGAALDYVDKEYDNKYVTGTVKGATGAVGSGVNDSASGVDSGVGAAAGAAKSGAGAAAGAAGSGVDAAEGAVGSGVDAAGRIGSDLLDQKTSDGKRNERNCMKEDGMNEIACLLKDRDDSAVEVIGLDGSDGLKFLISAFDTNTGQRLGGFNPDEMTKALAKIQKEAGNWCGWYGMKPTDTNCPTIAKTMTIDRFISDNSQYVVELQNVFSTKYIDLFPDNTLMAASLPVTDPDANVRAISASVRKFDWGNIFSANWRLHFDSDGDVLRYGDVSFYSTRRLAGYVQYGQKKTMAGDFNTWAKKKLDGNMENVEEFVKRSRDLFADDIRATFSSSQYDDIINKFFNMIEGVDENGEQL